MNYWDLTGGGDYLSHHGIKGQQWGERNGPPYPLERLEATDKVDAATKKVINNYNTMTDKEFTSKYKVSKKVYSYRYDKYIQFGKHTPLRKMSDKLRGTKMNELAKKNAYRQSSTISKLRRKKKDS